MSTTSKILFGLLAIIAMAWFFHGPMKLGAGCAAKATPTADAVVKTGADTPDASIAAARSAPPPTPAAVQPVAVANCQAGVDVVIKGKTVNFASGGSTIAVESGPLVTALAAALRDCDTVIVEVAGHTDAKGSESANLRLSEERANAVVQALMAEKVPGEKLLPRGYGESRPLDSATNEAAHARNRRIEFIVASRSGAAKPAGR